MAVFRENGGLNIRFWFYDTSLCGTASFDVFCVKITVGASAVASLKNQKNEIIAEPERIRGEKTHGPIWSKFSSERDVLDVIT